MRPKSLIRRLTDRIMLGLLRIASSDQREWALAMAGETEAIQSDWQAFWFALGCYRLIWSKSTLIISVARISLALFLCSWAGVKLYLAYWTSTHEPGGDTAIISLPGWVTGFALSAAGLYAGAGVALFLRYWFIAFSGLLAVFLINSLVYSLTLMQSHESMVWLIALTGEDYVVWSLSLSGLFAILWFGHRPIRVPTL